MHSQQGVNTRVKHVQPSGANIYQVPEVRHAQPAGMNIYQRFACTASRDENNSVRHAQPAWVNIPEKGMHSQ